MQVKKFAATCISGVLALSLGVGMVGCGNANNASDSATNQEAAASDKAAETTELLVIGTKKDGAAEVALKNGLSAAFNALSLKAAGEQAYKDNLVPNGKSLAAGEEATLYIESPAKDATYDIRVTKADGSNVEFLAVPLPKIKSITLKEADGKYYVDYVETDGKSGSTKEAAAATAAAGAAAAGTAAAAAADSSNTSTSDESASNTESSAQSDSQDEAVNSVEDDSAGSYEVVESYDSNDGGGYADYSSYDGGGSVSYEAPAASAPAASAPAASSAPAQSADSCAPDVVLR